MLRRPCGTVRFDHQFLFRNFRKNINQFSGIFECQHTTDSEVKIMICQRKKLLIGIVTMQHPTDFSCTLFQKDLF